MTRRHITILAAVAIAAALTTALNAQQGQADVALRAAMETETVRGDFRGAIEAYKKVFETYRSNRPVAAQALFQLADLQQRMGNAEARATYAQIVKEYPDQPSVLLVAQARLATFAAGQSRASGQVTERLVLTPSRNIGLASISADGRFGVLHDDSETGGLGVRDMSTGQVTWIPGTNTRYDNAFEFLSPDFRLLAYMTLDDDDDASLNVVRNDVAAVPRTLLGGNGEFDNVLPGGWSTDGRSILTGLQRSDKTWQIAWVPVAGGEVRVVKSLGWRELDGRPSLSPDGRYIAFAALATNPNGPAPRDAQSIDTHVYVMAVADDSQEVPVVASAGNHWNPVWSPDGGHILFESDQAGRRGLWAVPVRDGRPAGTVSLVRDNLPGRLVGVTKDGSYYFSTSSRLDVISIVQLSANRTIPPAPTSGTPDLFGTAPAWSPDSKSIAVIRGAGIAIRSLETRAERFHASPGLGGPLVWFHDGTRVAVNVRRPGGLAWEAVDVVTGRFRELLPADPNELRSGGALSIDDKTLFYWSRSADGGSPDRIVAVDLTTGAKRDVCAIPKPRGFVAFALSPDGQTLAVRSYDPVLKQAQIDRVGTDGTGYRELYKPHQPPAGLSGLKWTKDGIFFTEDVGTERLVIMRLSADSGSAQRVGALSTSFDGFAINSDATRVAHSTVLWNREVKAFDNLLAVLKTAK